MRTRGFGRRHCVGSSLLVIALTLVFAVGVHGSDALAVGKVGGQQPPAPPFLGGSSSPSAPVEPAAAVLSPGFQDTTVFSGLTNPTVMRFASDGRIFVAEKSGVVRVFHRPDRHESHGGRRPERSGRRLLGPGPARAGARPGLPDQPVRLPALHLRRARPEGPRPSGTTDARLHRARRRTAASSAAGWCASRSRAT